MRHRQGLTPRSRTSTTKGVRGAVRRVDWASTSHAVTVLDQGGTLVDHWTLGHTEHDLDTILTRLAAHGDPADLPVAIERSDGLIVARLLAAGHPVVPISPGAFHAARPRWGAAGAKSDPGDSYKLADYLRTDGHRLRRLEPPDAVTCELQALVRLRDHVAAKTAASNQLGALLDAHWPGAKHVFCRLASKIALAFLTEFPTPQAAAQLTQPRLAAFCRRHAYRGGRHPAKLLERLRSAPTPPVGLDPAVLAQLVGAQVQLLTTLLASIAELDQAIGNRLGKHTKARLLARLPRAGQVSLAPSSSPRSGRSWTAPPAPSTPPARPAPPRSPGRPARPAACNSAWPPTVEPVRPCTSSPTTPATAHPGRPSSTPTPAPAANATPRPSASSDAPGCGSSGSAGTPTPLTTQPATAPNNASPPDDLTQGTQALRGPRTIQPATTTTS